MTLHVLARARSRPETRAALRAALWANLLASRAEPGCLRYDLVGGTADPDEFVTIELWRSAADVEAHMRTPHVAALLAAVPALVAAPPEIRTYQAFTAAAGS
jgi:quinol monooxygenase YgiN